MRKLIGYIPAVLFTAFYLFIGMTGAGLTLSMVLIWLACFWLSAFFLHKGVFWGSTFGLFPGVHMIYMSTQYTGQVIYIIKKDKILLKSCLFLARQNNNDALIFNEISHFVRCEIIYSVNCEIEN
ncbi:MAG: hypothetical protein E7411_03995 [Ruminococcaceae bacterium]|nr:hypothetical protein [Oscillospiraceae bacterium]